MTTSQFDRMFKQMPTQQPIEKVVALKPARCHHCKKDVTPEIFITPYFDKPLHRCPECRSKIQMVQQ